MYNTDELQGLINSPGDPVGKCQKMTDELSFTMSRIGIEHQVIEGSFEAWRIGGTGKAHHWYIKIRRDQIEDVEEDIIVDPTIRQFTKENYNENRVTAYIPEEHRSSGPIVKESNELYNAYSERPKI